MDKNFNKFIYDRHSDIIFSLSGSRVKGIKFHNKTLTLKVDSLFQYVNNEEVENEGEVCFKDCDLRLCSVLIFNKTLGKGHFTGDSISLEEFMDVHRNCEFEIITEGYFGNSTTYSGWLWEEGKNPVSAIMYIWNSGDMEYFIMSESMRDEFLEKEFDFSKAIKNPYIKELKKQVTIKISPTVIDYFKEEAVETGIPYQTLINLYLTECVREKRKLDISWK